MIEILQKLIQALREELQQYGEMLARLDFQQDLLMRRAAKDLLDSVAGIEEQGATLRESRDRREQLRVELTRALQLPETASFAELIPRLPQDYRPLVGALVSENNELLVRVHQRSRQNHLLLTRTVEMMQRFMSGLFPVCANPVYDGAGAVAARAALPSNSLYEAVG